MEIYVEHVISDVESVMENSMSKIEMDETVFRDVLNNEINIRLNSQEENDSINDVHFEDSQEEKDAGVDDRFNLNEIGKNRKQYREEKKG
ncbi:hypothetical protein VNO77_25764 [Canavalia gladiata]|uniref:Uncharacterized protein n=1 Tax=Canavalia gladiata TaxID=3824 RepID=A0AAN9Q2U7_CANGL